MVNAIRAEPVGLEFDANWNCWSQRGSPQFKWVYQPGLDAGGQVVAAAWRPVKPSAACGGRRHPTNPHLRYSDEPAADRAET